MHTYTYTYIHMHAPINMVWMHEAMIQYYREMNWCTHMWMCTRTCRNKIQSHMVVTWSIEGMVKNKTEWAMFSHFYISVNMKNSVAKTWKNAHSSHFRGRWTAGCLPTSPELCVCSCVRTCRLSSCVMPMAQDAPTVFQLDCWHDVELGRASAASRLDTSSKQRRSIVGCGFVSLSFPEKGLPCNMHI